MGQISDSEEDDLEYKTTSVLLGYADDKPDSSEQSSADTISHLGGTPSWLSNCSPPDSRLAKCQSCNQIMPLLLQLDGNIPETPWHERLLYIFGCKEKRCRRKPGSIRALRGVKVVSQKQQQQQQQEKSEVPEKEDVQLPSKKDDVKMGDLLFGSAGSSSNPFSSASNSINPFATSSSASNPFAVKSIHPPTTSNSDVASLTKTFAQITSLNASTPAPPKPTTSPLIGPPSPWPELSSLPSYPSFFLDAHYEELDPAADLLTQKAQKLAQTVQMSNDDDDTDMGGSSAGTSEKKGGGKEKEVFESVMNETFDHFTTIVGQNPEQVLRYERRGNPLYYSNTDAVGKSGMNSLPRCSACGEKRMFELQLMPYAITVLEEAGSVDVLNEGLEWGTIIVATCGRDCSLGDEAEGETPYKYGYIEEWVGVQWEEDVKR